MKRLLALLFLAVVVVGVVRSMDAIALGASAVSSTEAAPSAARDVRHAGSGRLFVLMVDSLRYWTATDRAHMPYLVGLQQRSTHAKTLSSKDAVTVSALRAAFTGRDGFSVLGFVKNYWRGDAQLESLFRQAKAAGIRTAIYSDGSFDQFGPSVATYRSHEVDDGTERERQDRGADDALADFLSGDHDLVVFHLTYSDHAAHAWGIANKKYDDAFSSVDDLIEKLDRAIPPSDSFLVMGDHGHDIEGRHALGLDIPTYTSYRGPGFTPGLDLGTISIVEHRYLASWALGLPLDPSYAGARHPNALVPTGAPPLEYAVVSPSSAPGLEASDGAVSPRERGSFVALAVYLGLLFGVFVVYGRALTRSAEEIASSLGEGALAPWMHVSAWLTTVPLYLPGERPGSAIAGALAGAAWLYAATKNIPLKRRLTLTLLPLLVALFLVAWGYELAVHRVDIHEPAASELETFWEIAALTGAVLALLWGAMNVAWGFLAMTAVLFYPTVYRYGSPGTMAIVWCAWLLFLGVEHLARHARLIQQGPRAARAVDALARLVPGGVAATMLLPFFFPSSRNFQFCGWGGAFGIEDATTWFSVALAANLIVFVRVRAGAPAILTGLAAAGLVVGLEARPDLATGRIGASLFALLVALTAALHWRARRSGSRSTAALTRIATLACLEVASFYFIRVPVEAHQTADALFAALTLTSAFVAKLPKDSATHQRQTYLLLLGVLVAGWSTLAFTAHRLEWGVLYEWFPAAFVEKHVALLSPLLLGRYAIPLLMARVVLRERFGDAAKATRAALHLAMLKILGLSAVLAGLGYVSALSNVYIEAVEEAAIFLLLVVGFLPGFPSASEKDRSSREPGCASV